MSRRRFVIRYSRIFDKSIGLTVRVSLRWATYIGWLVGVMSAVRGGFAGPRAGLRSRERVRRCDLQRGYNDSEITHPSARARGRRQPVWGELEEGRRIVNGTGHGEDLTGGSSRR